MELSDNVPHTPASTPQCPVPTEQLREKIRVYSRSQREMQRARNCDALRFGLGEIRTRIEELENLTIKDVSGLAGRIKRRKHATVEDMYRLSHAFLQGIENIHVFSKTPGAVQVLIKELTGSDAARQISAVECLCNFSLGDEQICEKIANMAGSYIVTYLDSTVERLKRTALWTLTNLIATCSKPAQILLQMELVPKLWNLYVADICETAAQSEDDYRVDAAMCLQLITAHGRQLLRTEDLCFIKEHMQSKMPNSLAGEYHLQLIFNCEIVNPMSTLNREQLLYLINYALNNLCKTNDLSTSTSRLKIHYGVRLLANVVICQPEALSILLKELNVVWQSTLEEVFNKLFAFGDEALTKETLWLVRNVQQLEAQKEAGLRREFADKLKIVENLAASDFNYSS